MTAELAIVGGRVFDGTGAAEQRVDVGVHEGHITELAPELTAQTVIDASGLAVAPGFVDIHSHGDLVLAWPSERRLELLGGRLAQGITTEVVGNCGLGAAPVFGHGRELLPSIEAWMSPDAFPWEWTDLDGYFHHIESLGLPVNVGSLVPHGALRLGAAHLAPGETDAAARKHMSSKLDEALDQGGLGLSAGLIYPPGMYTSTDELLALARRLEPCGAVFACHIRGSSETLLDAVDELIHIGQRANVHVHHSHVEAVGRAHWSKLERFLERETRAKADGVELSADMFPYPVAATMMLAIYPPWSLAGGVARLVERLKDREVRDRIRLDIETRAPEWPPWTEDGWPHNLVKAVGWSGIRISTVASSVNEGLEGLTLEELGTHRACSPFDAISDLMIEEDGRVGQFVLDITGEDGLRSLVERSDISFITDANDFGKGKPHPAAYGSFPRVLGRFVREQGAIELSEAIRRMTSLPAETVGLRARGRLQPGAPADILIFDPEVIADQATLESPRQLAVGMETVIVNGEIVLRHGKPTGALPGRALRR